nr:ribonuclease H-like domain-containing protein [Tanacetum cinerariifolium]
MMLGILVSAVYEIYTNGIIKVLPPKTAEEVVARERERKPRTTLLMALPEDHLAKFHKMADAKKMWEANKSRFGGNDESKKMQKYLLKQQFEGFSVATSDGLHKGYDRFQTLLSQLEIHGTGVSYEDANQKFLSFDDLYNNLRVFERDVKGTTASSSNTHNVAFVSAKNTSSTNDNNILFTDTDCLVLSPKFKLPDENQVLPKIPRQHNRYSFNLKNNDPFGDLTCLFAKATLDESNLWHRRLGHINFKTMNKLVKGNLVRGLHQRFLIIVILMLLVKRESNIKPLLCGMKGIKREFSVARTPQQNGVAERKNRKLIESANKKHDEKAKRDDKGKSPVDSPTGVGDLRAEFEEFSFNSSNRVTAVSAHVNAVGPNPTNSTNNFNTSSPSVNVVSPNIGIAGKSSFVDPSKYLDDPDMPELEDIVYSDDEEDVGAKANLSHLEKNIHVSPILTTRVHKDHLVNQIIGDLIQLLKQGINDDDMEEMDLKWQVAMIYMRTAKLKGTKTAEEAMLGTMETKLETINSGFDNEVKSCSKACEESYARLKKMCDDQRDKLGDASVEIAAYTLALKKSVFMNKASDLEDTPDNDRFVDGMHATSADKSNSKPHKYASCESDSSVEISTSMPERAENASKVVCEPKVCTDAPIIEEYESDSDNDSVSNLQEDKEKPSFAFTDYVKHDDPYRDLKNKGIVDSGCSWHMTGNKAHLANYQEFKGGFVAFGGSNRRITGKGNIRTGRFNFLKPCKLSYPLVKFCVNLEAILALNLGANCWVLQLGTSSGMGEWVRGFFWASCLAGDEGNVSAILGRKGGYRGIVF